MPRVMVPQIVESLDELRSLLCSHLHRQQRLNSLLQEPRLLASPPMQVSDNLVSQKDYPISVVFAANEGYVVTVFVGSQ